MFDKKHVPKENPPLRRVPEDEVLNWAKIREFLDQRRLQTNMDDLFQDHSFYCEVTSYV